MKANPRKSLVEHLPTKEKKRNEREKAGKSQGQEKGKEG